MDYSHLITVEPGKRSGQPCIRGMRITVRDVLEYLAGGMSVDELLADFPELMLGSYPRTTARSSETDYVTMLTLESRDEQYMLRAVDSLVARIPGGALLKVD